MRVLHQLSETHKGIILFHDIHKQSVACALAPVIEELQRQDYTFLVYSNGAKFVKSTEPVAAPARSPDSAPVTTTTYGDSTANEALYT